VVHVLAVRHNRRSLLALALMTSQAFFYNAIFFTYALALVTLFLGVDAERPPLEQVCTPLGCDPEIPGRSPSR
jgi:hypothetical protein